MDVLRLPYGPWKPLLSGKYEGYDISLYQNPDRDIFSVVVDRDEEGNPKGLVVIMYRAFLVEGPVESLMNGVKVKTTLIAKRRAGETYRFLLIEEGPKYIGLKPEELAETLSRLGNALYKDTSLLRNVAKAMGVNVTALRDVPRKIAALMLAEPIVIPQMAGLPGMPETEFGKVLPVGKARDGNVAKESAVDFARTMIVGEHEKARKKMLAIIVENAMLSGIPVILLTLNGNRYENMNQPGDTAVKEYGITPMGFPRKIWRLGEDYFVDLNVVDKRALAEALGVSPEQRAFQEIAAAIDNAKGGAEKIEETIKVSGVEKYHRIQARRVVSLHGFARGKYFGRNNVTPLLNMGDVGEATILEMKEDIWTPVAAQSLLTGLLKFLEKRGKSKKIRALIAIEDADKITPRVKSPITEALANIIWALKDYGVGFVFETASEADVHKILVDGAETTVKTISDEEVGIRLLTKRPYRVFLRPLASNISVESQVPSASSQRVPPPAYT